MITLLKIPAVVAGLLCIASPVRADSFACHGQNPTWRLELGSDLAAFFFPSRTNLEVMLTTPAQGQDWPRAYTLIGDRDTAIVLLEQETCDTSDPYRAHVMTQRGQTPILLTGCCEITP